MGCCRACPDPFAPRKKCRLADFGQPETWDVFREAMQDPRIPLLQRIVRTQSSPSLSDLKADLPYARLKKALQSGILRAIRVTKAQRDLVAPAYWRASFDAHASGPATSRSALKAGICFRQSDVVTAETLVARGEFDRPVVGPEQAVGWLAYRDLDSFRSLGRSDLRGKRYYGASYEKDYVNLELENKLFVALVEGKIKGYRSGVVLTQKTRMRLKSIWEFSDLEFFRMELIEIWPPLSVTSVSTNVISPTSKEPGDPSPNDTKVTRPKRGKKRTGPKTGKTVRATEAMRADVDEGDKSLNSLSEMNQDILAHKYGVKSRSTAVKALRMLLDEADTFGTLPATNSGQ